MAFTRSQDDGMFLTLLSLALLGTPNLGARCVPASDPAQRLLVPAFSPGGFGRAIILLRGEWPRTPRRRSRNDLDPDDDPDEEGGAGARKAQPLPGLLPTAQQATVALGAAPEDPLPTSGPARTPLIYALCTLLL
jgi:hypothetical protein